MHPLTMLQKIVEDLDAEMVEHNYRPDVFGSGFVVYSKCGKSVRVVWDGKEGWGFLQAPSLGGSWADASPLLTEGDLEGVPQNHAKIAQFRQAAAALLSTDAA
jgi:hypothetical protein